MWACSLWWFTGSHIGRGIFIIYFEFFCMGALSTPLHLFIQSVIYINTQPWIFIFYFGLYSTTLFQLQPLEACSVGSYIHSIYPHHSG